MIIQQYITPWTYSIKPNYLSANKCHTKDTTNLQYHINGNTKYTAGIQPFRIWQEYVYVGSFPMWSPWSMMYTDRAFHSARHPGMSPL